MIELRFYRQRYNMDPEYYEGNDDIYAIFRLDFKTLKKRWGALLKYFEGETYSAWSESGNVMCGGAFDPDDIEIIKENFEP